MRCPGSGSTTILAKCLQTFTEKTARRGSIFWLWSLGMKKRDMDSWVVQMFTPHCPSVWWEASCPSQPHLLTPQWTNFDLRQYFHHKQIFSETWYQTWNYLIDTLYNPCWVTKFQIWWKCWFLMTLLCG